MSNIIPLPLPAGPFFCAHYGRYLPALTDLVIQAEAMLQGREIEEQLLKLRLKQKCFLALAAPPAHSIFSVERSDPADRRSPQGPVQIHLPASGGVHLVSPAVIAPPNSLDFEAPRLTAPEQHNAFPNGRWTKGEWKL